MYDAAWVTIHMGIVNKDFDLIRAQLCFKGKIKYDLNILAVREENGIFKNLYINEFLMREIGDVLINRQDSAGGVLLLMCSVNCILC